MEHYYTSNPTSVSEERYIEYKIGNTQLKLVSDNGVFSKAHVDFATDFMLKVVLTELKGTLMDMGCRLWCDWDYSS